MTVIQDKQAVALSSHVKRIHQELGIPASYTCSTVWEAHSEPEELIDTEPDYYGRPQRLTPAAFDAWSAMKAAAAAEEVVIHLISAFRSIDYQRDVILRKLDQGRSLDEILQVNAAPGYSEHHTGRAIDVGTEDCPALQEQFENTEAFRWLQRHAGRYGFVLSYPRGNSSGIAYEPWHWCYHVR